VRNCECGVAIRDDEAICPACRNPVPSAGRRGRLPAWVRGVIGLVVLSFVAGYWWFFLTYSVDPDLAGADPETLTLAQENIAKGNLQILNNAQRLYRAEFGSYAPSLITLGPAKTQGAARRDRAALIGLELAAGKGGDYMFRLDATDHAYRVIALPQSNEKRNSFWSDQTGEVHTGKP
jgi:hypothetical protein